MVPLVPSSSGTVDGFESLFHNLTGEHLTTHLGLTSLAYTSVFV